MNNLLVLICAFAVFSFAHPEVQTPTTIDTSVLIGEWKLDMTPDNPNDAVFAKMIIRKADNNSFSGIFYRDGVRIQNGRLNTQTGTLYGALISGDNSGNYNSTFYFQDGMLYGTTHAIERSFLSVWTATRVEQ